jgi:hypothetical protein
MNTALLLYRKTVLGHAQVVFMTFAECVCVCVCVYRAMYSFFEDLLVYSPNRRTNWTYASQNEHYLTGFNADRVL